MTLILIADKFKVVGDKIFMDYFFKRIPERLKTKFIPTLITRNLT